MMIRKRTLNRPEMLWDTIVGDGDDETLIGTDAGDLIQGLGGADSLVGLGGKDRIEGGGQQDTLVGGKGRDTLIGRQGDDLFRFESATDSRPGNADVITLFRKGDALDLSAIDADKGTAGDQDFVHVAALTGVAGQLAYSSNGAGGTIVEGDVDGDAIADIRIEIRDDRRDSLEGTDGIDTLIGYGEGETIDGGDANDVLIGGGGDDSLFGGSGFDVLDGGVGNDTIAGFADQDTIHGRGGDDSLTGGGRDIVDGGTDNDTISVNGDSTAFGGSGDDSILATGGPVPIEIGMLSGGDGNDTISIFINRFEMFGDDGSDYLEGAGSLYGGADNDTLLGDDGGDLLAGGDGTDLLEGRFSPDTLIGGLGADTLDGGEKQDVFVYEALADSTPTAPDLIVQLTDAKKVDLSAIDADANAGGDQAFTRVPDFTGAAGQLRLRYDGGLNRTFIEGDVDGDAVADFVIMTQGDKTDYTNFEL